MKQLRNVAAFFVEKNGVFFVENIKKRRTPLNVTAYKEPKNQIFEKMCQIKNHLHAVNK